MIYKPKIVFLLCSMFSLGDVYAESTRECTPILEATLQNVMVYRSTVYDKSVNECIPNESSYIKTKSSDSTLNFDGFVTGLNIEYFPDLRKAYAVRSKIGAHTTTLFYFQVSEKDGKLTKLGEDFVSSLDRISTYHLLNMFYVQVLNEKHEDDCYIMENDRYVYNSSGFRKMSSYEVIEFCEKDLKSLAEPH